MHKMVHLAASTTSCTAGLPQVYMQGLNRKQRHRLQWVLRRGCQVQPWPLRNLTHPHWMTLQVTTGLALCYGLTYFCSHCLLLFTGSLYSCLDPGICPIQLDNASVDQTLNRAGLQLRTAPPQTGVDHINEVVLLYRETCKHLSSQGIKTTDCDCAAESGQHMDSRME